MINIPPKARRVIAALEDRGYEAFVVGGCVRDALLGIEPHDWDICTNAVPGQMKECFTGWNTIDIGIQHGTVGVVVDKEVFEVTAYRIDGAYSDNRHPDSVSFTSDIADDLARRDFTVNAMAYSESRGLVDPYNGVRDLRDGIIRCVGSPTERFNEDALRILRALRFAARFEYKIEAETSAAILRYADLLNEIAAERIRSELEGILTSPGVEPVLNEYRDVIARFIPEFKPSFDFDQSTVHHCYDVYRHIVRSVREVRNDPVLRTVMFFHDIGKPFVMTQDCDGTRHFKGHQQVSADLTRIIMRRLRYSNAFTDECLRLILYHDVRFNGSKKQVRRVASQVGMDHMPKLFEVMTADTLAQSDYMRREKLQSIETARRHFEQIKADNECISLKELKINGKDLIDIGIADGKTIGTVLYQLFDEVIDERLPNKKNALLKRAKQLTK